MKRPTKASMKVKCPHCGVLAGKPCLTRVLIHNERYRAAHPSKEESDGKA